MTVVLHRQSHYKRSAIYHNATLKHWCRDQDASGKLFAMIYVLTFILCKQMRSRFSKEHLAVNTWGDFDENHDQTLVL